MMAAMMLPSVAPVASMYQRSVRSYRGLRLAGFVVLGVMNLAAMVVLAVVVLAEKLWVHGELLARVVGVAAQALAVAAIWMPELAPGLHGTSQMPAR
jgi:predicted metal-binding membrane protein